MKHTLLALLMLCLTTTAFGQAKFAFNSANYDPVTPKVNFVNDMTSLEDYSMIKSISDTGPYNVDHDQTNYSLDIKLKNVFDVLKFDLIDIKGQKVNTKISQNGSKIMVSLDQLPHGIYVLKLHDAQETFTTKIQHGI